MNPKKLKNILDISGGISILIIVLTAIAFIFIGIPHYINNGPKEYRVLEFQNTRLSPVVEIEIADTTMLFLIDTGASMSFLDLKAYEDNKDKFSNIIAKFKIGVTNLMSDDSLTIYIVNGLVFGKEHEIKILDSHIITELNKDSCNISGIIGKDYLTRNHAIINYKNKTLKLKK